ncbi:hypothetical protein [Escherichia coli]|uniref:hypothetical protein n=1 Tax=Escherichia coli TaxID=562 RepID=UPI003D34CDCC
MARVEGELFKIALASLEAKPIGAFHIAEQQVDGTSDYLKDGEWPIDNGIIEVYAAPPVPVVPEEKPMPNPLSMYAVDAVAAIAEVRGWNACRAAMLQAGNSPVTPDCWCHTCRPVTMSDMRFVVCPDCGNKRCPRANDHRNDCTGSNEPGHVGSAYPTAPQQEVIGIDFASGNDVSAEVVIENGKVISHG